MPPDIAEALVRRAREGEPVPLVPIPSGIWRQTATSDANDAGKPYRLIRTDDEDDHEWEGSILGQHVPGYRRIQILTDFIRDNWPEHTSEIKFSTIRPAIAQAELRRLIEKIADLVREKKLEGISDIRDESDRQGMRVVVELKRDAISSVVLNNLYATTPLETTFGAPVREPEIN